MLILLATLFACGFILTIILFYMRNGIPLSFHDEKGTPIANHISEKIFVEINGMKQGMFIKGKNTSNPLLLFLHGGPGMPEYAISRCYPNILEDYFTVCWWEQRGAGLSYNPGIPLETMTFEQLIADTISVTNYLIQRFGQPKIYLMAHSGGSLIGLQTVSNVPSLYRAYISTGQITNQFESEKLAYIFMKEQYKSNKNAKMLRKIEKYTIEEINTPSYKRFRDEPMHKLGIGTTHRMKSVINGIFRPVMLQTEYTMKEKMNVWRGKYFTSRIAGLWDKLVETDLTNTVQTIQIPVYFLHGIFDYTTSYILARDYFNRLEAPLKGFYTFDQSAHSPLFEEPEKMKLIIEDILAGTINHADNNSDC